MQQVYYQYTFKNQFKNKIFDVKTIVPCTKEWKKVLLRLPRTDKNIASCTMEQKELLLFVQKNNGIIVQRNKKNCFY